MMHGFTTLEINHHSPYTGGSDDLMVSALSMLLDDLLSVAGRPNPSTDPE